MLWSIHSQKIAAKVLHWLHNVASGISNISTYIGQMAYFKI